MIPGTVCASFSCELFLKYILLIETGQEVTGHGLADLYRKCNAEVQDTLINLRTDIPEIFGRNNKQFVEA